SVTSRSPEGVKLMTMISMEQEAVSRGISDNVSGDSRGPGNRRRRHYDRRITCDTARSVLWPSGDRHSGSTPRGRRMLRASPIARSAKLREAAPPATLLCKKEGKNTGGFRNNRNPSPDKCV